MSVKIAQLEIENAKRVKAVAFSPAEVGLTTIGGNNCQGKTSILDNICYNLGGEKYRPSNFQREGAESEAYSKIVLTNGIVVERKGKNSSLKVTDPNGVKAGQKLLDEFIEELALNLPRFMQMNAKEKAGVLLSILGIEQQLKAIDEEEKTVYDERTVWGRVADQKEKYAAELPFFEDAPDVPVSSASIIAEGQEIMHRNADKANQREHVRRLQAIAGQALRNKQAKENRVNEIRSMLEMAERDLQTASNEADLAGFNFQKASQQVIEPDESTGDIERKLNEIESVNEKVKSNASKQAANKEAKGARDKYNQLTADVEAARAKRMALLNSVKLPLTGLGVENGELVYNGQKWDCMSGMEQIKVATAIIRQRKPECGFILLDKLEAFDLNQLNALSEWLTENNMQAIATRVSTGEECSIIIEDGMIKAENNI